MWFVYRFTGNDAQRGIGPPFEVAVSTFSEEVRTHFGAQAFCVAASARATGGGIEIWFRLARPPDGDAFWESKLKAHGLSARRVAARA
ncbi:MAG: hypothetical protein ABI846_10810 [Rudaea sp.]